MGSRQTKHCEETTTHCEATTTISAGPDTHYACFLMGLKLDIYQPKYGNHPYVYTVTPCPPGKEEGTCLGKYGVGTKFSGKTFLGTPEIVTITRCSVPSDGTGIVAFDTSGILITHTTTPLPSGDCQYTIAMDGPNMGQFTKQMTGHLNKMKEFVTANVKAICDEARNNESVAVVPPPAISVVSVADPTAKLPSALCSSCGMINENRNPICAGCGACPTGNGPTPTVLATAVTSGTEGEFVDVPQHAAAQ